MGYVSPDKPNVSCLEDVSSITFKLASDENKSEEATISITPQGNDENGCPEPTTTATAKECAPAIYLCGLVDEGYTNGLYEATSTGVYSNPNGYEYEIKKEGDKFIIGIGRWPTYTSTDMPNVSCLEDVSSITFKLESDENKSEVATISTTKQGTNDGCPGPNDTTTTAAPTTNPCPPCRNVMTGPLKGNYKHAGSGDVRCTYDGCLYTKDNEEYCFQTGSETVQEVCPT